MDPKERVIQNVNDIGTIVGPEPEWVHGGKLFKNNLD